MDSILVDRFGLPYKTIDNMIIEIFCENSKIQCSDTCRKRCTCDSTDLRISPHATRFSKSPLQWPATKLS